jgi:transcriptional regulator with XRE-family HTH domain
VAVTTCTDEPLSRALPTLMRERGLTYRALAARTRERASDETGVTSGHLANLVSGRNRASAPVLELIAIALDVRPEYFAEYRLAVLRRSLDERAVGFDEACRRYSELTRCTPGRLSTQV